MTDIKLYVNDVIYSGWLSVDVKLSIEALSGIFNLTLTDKWAASGLNRGIQPSDACSLYIDNDVVITGYVDRVAPSFTDKTHTVSVTGRDKAGDLIDCSIIGSTSQYTNLKIEQIITQLCAPFGIPVSTDVVTGDIVPLFSYDQTMSVFEAIQKLCKMRKCLALSNGVGGILITRASDAKAQTALAEGINILAASAEYDYSVRFSQYTCKGQQQTAATLPDTTQPATPVATDGVAGNYAVATDTTISRYRPLLIVADGPADMSACQQRVDWEKSTRIGKSQRYTITVAGWRQDVTGTLWKLNQLVTFKSDLFGVFGNYLIASVNFKLDESGEITILELTPREAYLSFEAPDITVNKYISNTTDTDTES